MSIENCMLSSTLQINLYFNVLINEDYFKVNVYMYYSIPYFSWEGSFSISRHTYLHKKICIFTFTVINIDTYSGNMFVKFL